MHNTALLLPEETGHKHTQYVNMLFNHLLFNHLTFISAQTIFCTILIVKVQESGGIDSKIV